MAASPRIQFQPLFKGEYDAYFLDPSEIRVGTVVCRQSVGGFPEGWLLFQDPESVLTATSEGQVADGLKEIDLATERGEHIAGFITYDAAPTMDSAIRALRSNLLPLAWFGFYRKAPKLFRELVPHDDGFDLVPRGVDLTHEEYLDRFHKVKSALADGSAYQVNLTYRQTYSSTLDGFSLFRSWCGIEPPPYACFVEGGEWQIASLSPELLLQRQGAKITMKPMKGTAPRGTTNEEERISRACLRSAKTVAENLMIVDMVRNDLGKVAEVGTVQAPKLMETEIHRDILQVTSTVTAEVLVPNSRLIRSIFPPASVTGAPKVSSCGIIADLEASPRGIYCGAVGCWGPNNSVQLNVAIRTAFVRPSIPAEIVYGVGGGIVWDSEAEDEFSETQLKLQPILKSADQWRLVEAFNVAASKDQIRIHLARLSRATEQFEIRFDSDAFFSAIVAAIHTDSGKGRKLRITLSRGGKAEIEIGPSTLEGENLTAFLASKPSRSDDPNYRIKTNSKSHYREQKKLHRSCDDVLFYNERDEITEFSSGNVVIRLGGDLVTPHPDAGLVSGITLRDLIAKKQVREARITLNMLKQADRVYVTNAVIGMKPINLLPSAP